MNHCCEHECKHEQVKFCQGCKAVYCASCKHKWVEPCTFTHYPYTYTTTGYIDSTGGTLAGPLAGSSIFSSSDCAVHV